MTNKRLQDYQEQLLLKLQDEEFATAYLNEALENEDPRMFLLALKNVINAQKKRFNGYPSILRARCALGTQGER